MHRQRAGDATGQTSPAAFPGSPVRPDLVVVLTTQRDARSGLLQRLEPFLVQALVPELSVEALDVAVLHRPAWLDQDVPDAVAVRPGHESPAGELRAVVRSHRQRVAAKQRSPVQDARDVLT